MSITRTLTERKDEHLTTEEIRLMQSLKGKSRMEQDQIIYEYERIKKNGYTF